MRYCAYRISQLESTKGKLIFLPRSYLHCLKLKVTEAADVILHFNLQHFSSNCDLHKFTYMKKKQQTNKITYSQTAITSWRIIFIINVFAYVDLCWHQMTFNILIEMKRDHFLRWATHQPSLKLKQVLQVWDIMLPIFCMTFAYVELQYISFKLHVKE